MNKKKFLACMMAMAMTATTAAAFIPAGDVEAAGLTQATSADQVKYGSLTEDDEAVLKTLFDFEYYKAQNPELVSILGDDFDKLFEHFCKCGIFEGRTCNENFDPSAYASAYGDLKEVYGNDIIKYYKHYAIVGSKENRTLTTVKACAEAGITVESVVASEVKITPAVYKIAMSLGTTEFAKIQNAVNKVAAQAKAEDIVIASSKSGDANAEKALKAIEIAKGLEKVSTISLSDSLVDNEHINITIYVIKGEKGYAAYKRTAENSGMHIAYINTEEIYKSDDFESGDNDKIIAKMTELGIGLLSEPEADTYSSSQAGMPAERPFATNPTSGNQFYIYGGISHYVSEDERLYISKEVAEYDTCTVNPQFEVYGYVAEDGSVIEFTSAAERDAYLAEYNANTTGRTYEATHYYDSYYYDPKGDTETVYDIGLKIEEKGDDKIDVTIGVSNEENGFAQVSTYEYTDFNTTNNENDKYLITILQNEAASTASMNQSSSDASGSDNSEGQQ